MAIHEARLLREKKRQLELERLRRLTEKMEESRRLADREQEQEAELARVQQTKSVEATTLALAELGRKYDTLLATSQRQEKDLRLGKTVGDARFAQLQSDHAGLHEQYHQLQSLHGEKLTRIQALEVASEEERLRIPGLVEAAVEAERALIPGLIENALNQDRA